MNYHKLLLILILTIAIANTLYAQTSPKDYFVPKSKIAKIDTYVGYGGDTTKKNNIDEEGIIGAYKDIKTNDLYKNRVFLLSNVLPIATNPYSTESSKEKYVYTYKLIKEQGMVVGIDQTIEMYDELIYEDRLMIGNIQHSQLFFERTIDEEPLLYFAHYLLDNGLQEDEYIERYFVMLQVINPNTNTIAIEDTFEISTIDNSSNNYRFRKKFVNEMKVLDILIADDDTIYVNTKFSGEYERPKNYSGDGSFGFTHSQLYSIESKSIKVIYASNYDIVNLLMDNNNVLYFLEDSYDPRKTPYLNASAINRRSGADFVMGITEDEQLWSIYCFLSIYDYHPADANGCFDLQLDSDGTLYLLTSFGGPLYYPSRYPDSVSTIYTINTNGTGIGGYAKPALQSIKKENREPLYKKPRARLNDSNVNVRAGYSLQNTVLFQVHEGTMLELRERTKSKYPIGEMEDYWYKGYVLEKDGVTRKTQDGEEVDVWIYGAFLDMLEEAEIQDLERKAEIQKYMMPIIIGIVALLLVGLGVIVRKKQKNP